MGLSAQYGSTAVLSTKLSAAQSEDSSANCSSKNSGHRDRRLLDFTAEICKCGKQQEVKLQLPLFKKKLAALSVRLSVRTCGS